MTVEDRNAEYERIKALPADDPERVKVEALVERVMELLKDEDE